MSRLRTANLLGALAVEITGRVGRLGRSHHSETSSTTAALNMIGLCEGCSNGELGLAIGLSHTATVRLVDKLEAAGLVVRGPGKDGRAVSLTLSEAGRARAISAVHERCLMLGDVVALLSDEQRDQLDGIAETLLRALVGAARDAGHICRLCDVAECPQDRCPVHLEELALRAA